MSGLSRPPFPAPAGTSPVSAAGWDAGIQCLETKRPGLTELRLVARPAVSSTGLVEQAGSMYENLLNALRSHGARPSDIVTEKIFLSDVASQTVPALAVRRRYLHREDAGAAGAPALSIVGQPPALGGRLCEVQAFVVAPSGGGRPLGRSVADLPAGVTGRVIEDDELRQVFLSGFTGGSPGDRTSFAAQASSVFSKAVSSLTPHGLGLRDVVRTWIYLDDIDRDYDALNRVRRETFARYGVSPAPASTGIKGHAYPPDRLCAMDLLAIEPIDSVRVRTLHAPTMNEAPSYGSDFCRGMTVQTRTRRTLYLSGTASIDTAGEVVSVGDIEGQVDRMLLNVEQLLAFEGATFGNLVTAITYLKRPEYAGAFREAAARRGFSEGIPNTLCVADVCRPEWLCEIEGIAVTS